MLVLRQHAALSYRRFPVAPLLRRFALIAFVFAFVVVVIAAPTYLVTAAFGWPPLIRLALAAIIAVGAIGLLLAIPDQIGHRFGAEDAGP